MKLTIIKIIFEPDNEILQDNGTIYIQTSNQVFIEEVHKYRCPIRLASYLDFALGENENVEELTKTPDNYDLFISLVEESLAINKEYIQKGIPVEEYLKITNHLDKYG